MVALTLGKLMAEQTVNAEVKQGIQWLGYLSQDTSSLVRKLALQSIGKVRSESVIPLLQSALQDPDMEVIAIASAIMQTYKGCASSSNSAKANLPENSALKVQKQPE